MANIAELLSELSAESSAVDATRLGRLVGACGRVGFWLRAGQGEDRLNPPLTLTLTLTRGGRVTARRAPCVPIARVQVFRIRTHARTRTRRPLLSFSLPLPRMLSPRLTSLTSPQESAIMHLHEQDQIRGDGSSSSSSSSINHHHATAAAAADTAMAASCLQPGPRALRSLAPLTDLLSTQSTAGVCARARACAWHC